MEMSHDWTKIYQTAATLADEDENANEEEKQFQKQAPQVPHDNPFAGCDHDHTEERRIFELPTSEKLNLCMRYKNLGNLYSREGQFERAQIRYQQSLIYYEYILSDTDEEEKQAEEVRIQCLANMAICCLQLGQFRKTIELCSQALKPELEDSLLVKVLYRRAQAYRHLGEYENSAADLRQALTVSPSSKTLQQEIELLRMESAFHRKQQQELAHKVFGSGGKQEAVES
eukprot:gb/GECG01016086.1/.p1 GENE.gb/GECG01016086.1/~~gb/GECG01016086.1/.p1  ORF type:complete len:229 (+),score=39.88 gb/GECG01016086.1/:1-687(+)